MGLAITIRGNRPLLILLIRQQWLLYHGASHKWLLYPGELPWQTCPGELSAPSVASPLVPGCGVWQPEARVNHPLLPPRYLVFLGSLLTLSFSRKARQEAPLNGLLLSAFTLAQACNRMCWGLRPYVIGPATVLIYRRPYPRAGNPPLDLPLPCPALPRLCPWNPTPRAGLPRPCTLPYLLLTSRRAPSSA